MFNHRNATRFCETIVTRVPCGIFPSLFALHSSILFVMKFKPAVIASFDGFRHFEALLDEADEAFCFVI